MHPLIGTDISKSSLGGYFWPKETEIDDSKQVKSYKTEPEASSMNRSGGSGKGFGRVGDAPRVD